MNILTENKIVKTSIINGVKSTHRYRYAFNGMEKDDEVKGTGNSYDFGARMYDSRLGRWMSKDPLAIKFPGWSPYSYAYNNPLFYFDPNGEDIFPFTSLFIGPLPETVRDLGFVGGKDNPFIVRPIFKADGSVDVEINFKLTVSSIFNSPDFIAENHKNLEEHVITHENEHIFQWTASFNETITIVFDGDEYSGRIDEIATDIYKKYTNIINVRGKAGEFNSQEEVAAAYAERDAIFAKAFRQVIAKIKAKHDEKYTDTRTEAEKEAGVPAPEEKDAMDETTKKFNAAGKEEPTGDVTVDGVVLPEGDND